MTISGRKDVGLAQKLQNSLLEDGLGHATVDAKLAQLLASQLLMAHIRAQ